MTDWVGVSRSMREVSALASRVAGSAAPVLLCGESGTGKEVIAHALHSRSPRSSAPFVAVNCAALPGPLLESELFGHVRGAFTDARAEKRGLFVEAAHGTLFLDEIGELPLELQPKLLRALQERKVRPVGGTGEIAFDARVIAATNRDLELAVREHRFREDLFYRINVVRIDLPPLRERREDIVPLAKVFLDRASQQAGSSRKRLSEEAAAALEAWSWPGNVRELENCIEGLVALVEAEEIGVEALPSRIRAPASAAAAIAPPPHPQLEEQFVTLEELSQRYVQHILLALRGNKSKTAEALGIDRRTLYRMLARQPAS